MDTAESAIIKIIKIKTTEQNTDIRNINLTAAVATNSHITAAQFLHTT